MITGAIDAGCGTGATVSLLGTDSLGSVVLNSGTGTDAGASFVLLFSQKVSVGRSYIVDIFFLNSNAGSATASVTIENNAVGKPIGFRIACSTLSNSTAYQFAYQVSS
jgi:hypothetical protein